MRKFQNSVSRKIFEVRQKFVKLHTVWCTLWSLWNFCITIFWKISVKTTSSVKSLLYNWFHEINFKWYKNFVNSTLWRCSVEKRGEKFTAMQFFSSNQLCSNFVSKTVTFTKFLPKRWFTVWSLQNFCITWYLFR